MCPVIRPKAAVQRLYSNYAHSAIHIPVLALRSTRNIALTTSLCTCPPACACFRTRLASRAQGFCLGSTSQRVGPRSPVPELALEPDPELVPELTSPVEAKRCCIPQDARLRRNETAKIEMKVFITESPRFLMHGPCGFGSLMW
jgi:hypothetical protein